MTAPGPWNYNGWLGVDRDIRLRPGVYDEDAEDVFRRGHCHSLAFALIELLPGAELYGAWEGGSLDHVLVRLPDGRYLDGSGITTRKDILRHWHRPSRLGPLDAKAWERERGRYRPSRVEDARPFAKALIEREGIEIEVRATA